jgi:rhamnosyltransferase
VPFLPADSGQAPRVTVFIPTWNGGPLFDEVLAAICAQETSFPFEVLAIDSGSKDGTLDVLAKHRVRVIRIPNTEFNHGLTRNRAVQEARGEIVALTVQDATPAGRDWLATMAAAFDDPEVAGVYCHQIPRPDCSPFLRDRLKSWVRGGGQPAVRQVGAPEAFWALHPIERFQTAAFDNVASAVRRSFALAHPFPRRQFGEDVTWARGAILAGKKIVMEPRVAVIHSHQNSIWYEFRRVYLDHQNLNDLFGLRLVPTLRSVVSFTADATRHLWRVVSEDPTLAPGARLAWRAKVIPFAFTQNLAQYLGQLSNVHGRRGLWRAWDRIARRGV